MNKSRALLVITLVILNSCASWVDSARKMIDGDEKRQTKAKVQWVSKNQYDQLAQKYENLNKKYSDLQNTNQSSQIDNLIEKQPETQKQKVNESINVFANQPKSATQKVVSPQDDLTTFNKAVTLFNNGKVNDSLKLFQFLDRTASPQIKVRSRIYIGEIYLKFSQYDLALQVYETILSEDVFSSYVISALRGAHKCSGKLGLKEKEQQYLSMLDDVFGVGV